ncbi:MAG: Asp-tRNA(Asn)/Glu-tRNA(Gln) amidotransferase subunit GatA [Patescibacteria group bacterium]|nr:Asp-tRNA(Asn)/Glu-tRNA(Gln) amidotransferase subunit GatA [Patescibacteria group bacterium]
MKSLNQLTIKQASQLLAKKEITSVALTEACLKRIKEIDGKIKACLTVCEKEALAEAKKADERRAAGESGDLLGIPYFAKDNILTRGIKTTAASKILANYIAPYDATIIKKLKQAGAVLLGKTNLDEFAHGSSTENSAFGPTHNPWDLTRVPGGSSGGSAAAVASDMCLFALGTDTCGSIRYPAGFCGIVGLKPTYGRSSRFGLIAMTSSTDVPGPLAKTVEDAAIVLSVIAGVDENDATTVNQPHPNPLLSKERVNLKSMTIGLPKEYFTAGTDQGVTQAIEQAVATLKKLGVKFKSVSLPHTKYAIPVYYIITPSEISSNLARFDGIKYGLSAAPSLTSPARTSRERGNDLMSVYTRSRGKGFGPEAKRRIMLGTYALSAGYYDAYYLQAQKVRTQIKQEMDKVLQEVDCLLTPTAPHVAFKIGAPQSADPLKMYLEDIFMAGASLSGLPAMSIPCGFDNGLPVGMQLIGRRFDEAMLFRVGWAYEATTRWHLEKPGI